METQESHNMIGKHYYIRTQAYIRRRDLTPKILNISILNVTPYSPFSCYYILFLAFISKCVCKFKPIRLSRIYR